MTKKIITDLELKGKKVLIRVDFNVPMDKTTGGITDDNRIREAIPTIKHVIENGGKAILFSHLGRFKSTGDQEADVLKYKKSGTLLPVAKKLEELIKQEVKFIPHTRGEVLESAIAEMESGQILMFENTRFEDMEGKKESKNDPQLGKYWASLGDVFVIDAFGTAHRAHASNVGIASNMTEVAAGFLLEKEIRFIGGAVTNPERPFVAILGGSKVSDKIEVISSLIEKADKILIGGGMMFTFLKALGYDIGKSICEEDKLDLAKELLEKAAGKIVLPTDVVLTKEFSNDVPNRIADVKDINADEMGLDIGIKTSEEFSKIINTAKTVVWNGPMGVFELSNYAKGTINICETLAGLKNANTIIGGGDSAAAAIMFGYADKVTHISTGGGASLEYLEGKVLPGIDCITDK